MPREVVFVDKALGTGELHFKAAGTLSGSADTDFYIYYGNPNATDYAVNATYGAQNVWNGPAYTAVYHLQQNPGGSSPQMRDSTSNARHGTTLGGMSASQSVDGKLAGKALSFDGLDDQVDLNVALATLISAGAGAASCWLKTAHATGPSGSVYEGYAAWSDTAGYAGVFQSDVSSTDRVWAYNYDGNEDTAGMTYAANDWIYAVWRHGGGTLAAFKDGASAATASSGNTQAMTGDVHIAGGFVNNPFGGLPWQGLIDEVRFTAVELASTWISTEYNNQSDPSAFYAVGSPQLAPSFGGGPTSYVDAGDNPTFDITELITLEAWLNVNNFPTSGNHAAIISKGFDGSKTGYYLGIHKDGATLKLIAGADDTLNAASWDIAGWTTDDEWVQVAAVYNGTHWKLFLNGDEKVSTSSVKAPVLSAARLLIGAYDNDGTAARFLDARVAHAAVYPVALTEAQLAEHYAIAVADTAALELLEYFPGAVTISAYDKNGNLLQRIGATNRNEGVGGEETSLTATIKDAFGCGADLEHTGDYALEAVYDAFDRMIQAVDAVGNVSESLHDPDGRVVQASQRGPAQGPTPIDRNGYANVDLAVSTVRFDEAGRQYESQQNVFLVTESGEDTPPATNAGIVVSTALPSTRAVTYTDENGSLFEYTYDALGRRIECEITPAEGVAGFDDPTAQRGTTAQAFEYDGLSRMRQSVDTTTVDLSSPQDAIVAMTYDSLSRVLEDGQTFGGNDRYVTHSAFTSFPASKFTFPQDNEMPPASRVIENAFDVLYRRTLVKEAGGADIASWQFFGPGRVAEVELANGLICTFMNNARTHSAVQANVANPAWGDDETDRLGYDGAGRMITKRYLAGGINGGSDAYNDPTSIVGFTTSFDKSSNKLYERHLHCASRSHLYQPFADGEPVNGYDSIDRLRQYQRGILASGGGSVATPISLPNAKEQQTYALDGLGNWKNTAFTPVGDPQIIERRDHNYLNQITATKEDSDPKTLFAYDGVSGASNGNLASDGTRSYVYDAMNRLVEVYKDPTGTPTLIGTYTYDALGRRIRKVVTNGGLSGTIPNGTTDFLYTGWRCIEERDGSDDPTKQMVWGIYIDELIQQKNITAQNNFSAGDELYPLQDLLYRTTGLADDAGTVREAYDCDAYGNTLIFRNAGTPPAQIGYDDADTQVEMPTGAAIFTGQRYDPELRLYYFRHRHYKPDMGRMCQRDALVQYDRNLYTYVRCNPNRYLDWDGYLPRSDWSKVRDPNCGDPRQSNNYCMKDGLTRSVTKGLGPEESWEMIFECGRLVIAFQVDADETANAQDDSDPPIKNHALGVKVNLSWYPPKGVLPQNVPACCLCKAFNWIQDSQINVAAGWIDNTAGWVPDVPDEPGHKAPFYNAINRTDPGLYDYPATPKPTSRKELFHSLLVCVDNGANHGKVFANIFWGYDAKRGASAVDFILFQGDVSSASPAVYAKPYP